MSEWGAGREAEVSETPFQLFGDLVVFLGLKPGFGSSEPMVSPVFGTGCFGICFCHLLLTMSGILGTRTPSSPKKRKSRVNQMLSVAWPLHSTGSSRGVQAGQWQNQHKNSVLLSPTPGSFPL